MKAQGNHRTDNRYRFHNWKEQTNSAGESITTVDIVDTATGRVVDKFYIDGASSKSWTRSGKSIEVYNL